MLTANRPFSLVIFGASGHLAKMKIFPALYVLFLKKRLPESFAIVGYARSDMDDASFRDFVSAAIRADLEEVNEKTVAAFLSHLSYVRGQYDKLTDFEALAAKLTALEDGTTDTLRLAYLSIPPTVFEAVVENLAKSGVRRGEFRCIVEKPVGHNLKSFQAVKAALMESLHSDEIYLLDHYLGKEAIRNLYYLRAGNPIIERIFERGLVHHVEIVAAESAGIENRAGYFDATGTFRDFFQSHLLMVASLLTMPLGGEASIAAHRLEALGQLCLPPVRDLGGVVMQAQYGAGDGKVSYLQEADVAKGSRANTFAALALRSKSERWQDVPFFLISGKRLDRRETRVSIQFEAIPGAIPGNAPNRLDVILQGEAGLKLTLQTKLGGSDPAFRPLVMADPLVCVGDCLPEHGLLLLEAIHGIKRWFLSFEEVAASWHLIDPLQAHLDQPSTPLPIYAAGSRGPKEAEAWIKTHGQTWITC